MDACIKKGKTPHPQILCPNIYIRVYICIRAVVEQLPNRQQALKSTETATENENGNGNGTGAGAEAGVVLWQDSRCDSDSPDSCG